MIKVRAARNIYLNSYDGMTQEVIKVLVDQRNQPRTDMTVCCMVLYKILSCDYDNS